jgi:phage-related minor tail protein
MENESISDGEQDAKSKAEKDEENKKELAHRTEQLNLVRAAIEKLDEAAEEARKRNKRRKALLSHLRTFYSEMNNIAKGKAMSLVPVAELMVTQINDAIADAKKLIEGDVYLDRVKPFISAGNPPGYPEVLLVAKTVEEVLVRQGQDFDARLEAIEQKQNEAATVEAGLECAMENIEYAVLMDDVEARLDDTPEPSWTTTDDQGEELFDLERLDTLDISAYFAEFDQEATEDEGDENDESEEDEDDE